MRWRWLLAIPGLLLSSVLLLSACSTQIAGLVLKDQVQPVTVSAQQIQLMTADRQSYALDQLDSAVSNALALQPQAENLTVFIHGMGPYPDKAYKHQEITALSEAYSSAVIMLNWPAWEDRSVLPRQNALASGRLLSPLWQQLKTARQQPALADKKLILVAHSMGAEVLRGISESAQPAGAVFDNLLLAAPETDLKGHAAWLNRVKLSTEKLVLVNRDDNMLPFARSVMKKPRLGLTLRHDDGDREPIAQDTRYLVLEDVTEWHSVYASRQSDEVNALLRGLVLSGEVPAVCATDAAGQRLVYSPEGCRGMERS